MASIPELEEIRRNQILEAALSTIAETGAAHVTMDDIAQAAGLSKGGLIHYYRSKNELFQATFKELFERIFELSRESMAQHSDPMEKILAFDFLYDLENPYTRQGYPLLFDSMALAAREPDYQAMFDAWVDRWIELLTGAIRQGIADGSFVEMDPDPLARTISAIYHGIAIRWYLAPRSHSSEWAVNSFRTAIGGAMAPYRKKTGQDAEKGQGTGNTLMEMNRNPAA
ncbi:MAG: TetR family transcriptional regulator [Proteobacteria bacterium]|nr:TetR family transcriptional regulator [Pseudomonadota bacterium]